MQRDAWNTGTMKPMVEGQWWRRVGGAWNNQPICRQTKTSTVQHIECNLLPSLVSLGSEVASPPLPSCRGRFYFCRNGFYSRKSCSASPFPRIRDPDIPGDRGYPRMWFSSPSCFYLQNQVTVGPGTCLHEQSPAVCGGFSVEHLRSELCFLRHNLRVKLEKEIE